MKNMKNMKNIKTFESFEEPDDAKALVSEDGGFISKFPENSMGYLEDLMKWIFYHDNMSEEEKLDFILTIESEVDDHCKSMGINYIRQWSKKLQEK